MTDFTDGYLTRYQYLRHVYDGTLQPQNVPAGVGGPFTGVKYRIVETDEEDLDTDSAGGGSLQEIQTFEIWTITLNNGGYDPRPLDIFTDANGQDWLVVKQDRGDLTSSAGLRPTRNLLCRKKQ